MIYSAITIGPIYETLERARKTRALWAASYFFSWFMKNLIIKLYKAGYNIILPALNSQEASPNSSNSPTFQSNYGAGLYADRVYFSYEKDTEPSPHGKDSKPSPQEIIKEVIDKASRNLNIDSNYFSQYLNVHTVEIEDHSGKFPLQALNDLLDLAEQHRHAPLAEGEEHRLAEVFENISRNSFLYRDAHPAYIYQEEEKEEEKEYRIFPSIPEITTSTLEEILPEKIKRDLECATDKSNKKEDDDYFKVLKNNKVKFYPFHKYYALIMADGDGVGKILSELAAAQNGIINLQNFSRKLFEFSLKAEEIFYNFGGRLVYGGGDDLMALAPVVGMRDGNLITLFQLIEQLDKAFAETILNFIDELKKAGKIDGQKMVSLSYGIMICYYKHPLKEARGEAHELLNKKYKESKNIVAIRFQKHSGQLMEAVVHKNRKATWEKILQLSSTNHYLPFYCKEKYDESKEDKNLLTPIQLQKNDLLSGVIHRLKDDIFETAFIEALKAEKLENFIKNSFNESIHINNYFLKEFTQLAEIAFKEYFDGSNEYNKENIQKFKNTLYMVLRYIHFINSEKERE